MRLPFPLRLERRRGLLVYQLVLILIGIIILILVLLYIARRHQIGTTRPAAETSTEVSLLDRGITHPRRVMRGRINLSNTAGNA
jgi:hypothetical protein